MPMLPLIADPDRYRACMQDLLNDGEQIREYWLQLFERHVEVLAALPQSQRRFDDHPAWGELRSTYLGGLMEIRKSPGLRGGLTVLELTRYRDETLARFGFDDPFLELKHRENEIAIAQYPAVIRELDSMDDAARGLALATGLFAGNLFDMGSKAAIDLFESGGNDFNAARKRVKPRPWGVDNLDAWRRVDCHSKCLFFVDNAGPDIVLGVIPLVREWAARGMKVVLAANSKPALNDVTADELRALLEQLATNDPKLGDMISERTERDGGISVVASGCTSPLIDLADVSEECCEAATDCDLLVLEGMGRAIESNYDARFTVDTLKVALIKDPMVADMIGVSLFDPVFRYEPAS